ncbi:tRNA pseudouridine synthase B [Symmachiella macrocystis]|uniref:tRNA pseudouridine synthase B n=1 Tax=Symmachiella macrocystis TaxID=2527985 RepID=A0A5C6BKT3_9PLAN|nr:tRNA pseudouridine(55) synthase TruB [Symmachiella macrocystis]TWU12680.1 tRNA pseudouridine synthase B [Symmachiella macrocystis]
MNSPDCRGILNINKPADITSRRVVDVVQRIVRPAKVGHGGTLDPLATGVVVVCIGAATRLISYVQQGRKEYRAQFRLGLRSNTDDITGEVESVEYSEQPTAAEVAQALRNYVGEIDQVPPQFSAVHIDGRRAYKMARAGKTLDIPARPVHVYRIDILNYAFPELEVEIECGSGTYIRSIGRDMGEELGCGAVMTQLERTRVGDYRLDAAVELDALSRESLSAALLPPLSAVAHLPRYAGSEADMENIQHGRAIQVVQPMADDSAATVAITAPDGRLAAIATCEDGILAPKNVFLH